MEINDEIFLRHFEGRNSPEEEKLLQEWLAHQTRNKEELEELKKVWDATGTLGNLEQSRERVYTKVFTQLNYAPKRAFPFRSLFLKISGAAAIILITFFAVKMTNQQLNKKSFAPEIVAEKKEVVDEKTGESSVSITNLNKGNAKGELELADNSVVELAAKSSVTYSQEFDQEKRNIALDGHAFFKVVSNPQRPFIVETDDILLTALGTSFSIEEVEEGETQVSLIEGSVSVKVKQSQDQYLLKPGERLTLENGVASITRVIHVNIDKQAISPTKPVSELEFNNASFYEVIHTLEHHYNVNIEHTRRKVFTSGFNGEFKNFTIEEILEGLCFSSGYNYKLQENIYVIY